MTELAIVPGAGGVTLDVAQRIQALAPRRVVIAARPAVADALLWLRLDGGASNVCVHPRAPIASRLFAGRIAGALAAVVGAAPAPPDEADLTVIDPRCLAPGCAACGVDLRRLGERLPDPRRRQELAEALARGALLTDSRSEHVEVFDAFDAFDIWHEVPLVEQLTGMSCWAAAAAMIVGWRDCIVIEAEEVAQGAGRWHAYRDGLEPRDVEGFARAWGLEVARPIDMSVAEIRRLLETFGPLWVGEASPGLHVIVIAGLHGDGSVDGTKVRIADPWPLGRGERYTIGFRQLRENLHAAATLAGGRPQILHAAAGARGASRRVSMSREVRTSVARG